MVGQGVMRECLLDPGVLLVQTVGRSATGVQHAKLHELVHNDLWHYQSLETQLSGFDACFFCLGVTSSGMKEENYERVTYGITTAAAEMLSRHNPQMIFIHSRPHYPPALQTYHWEAFASVDPIRVS
jgi:hypothetical protein